MAARRGKRGMLAILKQRAAKQVEMWPQYAHHFDKYVLCRIKRDIRTKMGTAFLKGETSICRPQKGFGMLGGYQTVDVWSMRNGVDTSLSASDVQTVGTKGGSESWRGSLQRRRRR